MDKLNAFLEKGNNKKIAQIVVGVVIGILSLITLFFIIQIISADTNTIVENGVIIEEYTDRLLPNLGLCLIFAILDCILILFAKPLYGFASISESFSAWKNLRAREKAQQKAAEAEMKAKMDAVRAERLELKAKRKAEKKAEKLAAKAEK